ncbi:uncharacterized protein LOC131874065 [Cryptomeria japonica]|uniref:uncharacterized protein LOC131874065 n=1 Tax=Cryptomeria japonica TaxID=3369 RepID=UPI0027DA35E2|nr:uncharacterized protein LOC131874065 [Cryptomeria japonica]
MSLPAMITGKAKGKYGKGCIDMLDEDLVAEVTGLQKEGTKFYKDCKFSVEATKNFPKSDEERAQLAKKDNVSYYLPHQGKARANREDSLVENAHISEAKEDTKENFGSEEEQGKEVDDKAESEQKKEAEGEEEKVQRKEYVEELEANNNPYVSDNRNDAQHSTEEGNPRFVVFAPVMENADSILNAARNSTLEMFNFQKWALKKFMEHSLKVLKVSSQNMNDFVACLEKNKQNKEMVIIDDVPATSSTPHSSRRKTRQTTSELEMKTKDTHQMQENKDLKEVANAMMMLVKDTKESIQIFI